MARKKNQNAKDGSTVQGGKEALGVTIVVDTRKGNAHIKNTKAARGLERQRKYRKHGYNLESLGKKFAVTSGFVARVICEAPTWDHEKAVEIRAFLDALPSK